MEVDNLIRNIVSEVSRECKNHKVSADPSFITYYVKLLHLNPNRGITEDVMKIRENIQSFIKFIVVQLQQQKENPKIVTLKLQNHLKDALKGVPEAVSQYRREQEKKLTTLQLAIIEPKTFPDNSTIYKRIAYYVILISRMGNPKTEQVFKETFQAVQSVMNLDEIEAFPSLQNYIRQEVLNSVVKVTSGVKLFNKHCNKGGAEIPNLPGMISNATEAVKISVQDLVQYYELKATSLTKLLYKYMDSKYIEDEYVWELKKGEEERDFNYIKDLLVSHKQLLWSMRTILKQIDNIEDRTEKLITEYNETLKTLKELVIPSMHQSVDQLFPLFTYLCELWMELQDQVIELKELKRIFGEQTDLLRPLNFERAFVNHERDYPMRSPSFLRSAVSALKVEKEHKQNVPDGISSRSAEENVITERNGARVIHNEQFKMFIKSTNKMSYCGYCCWTLVQSGGALILGKPELGIVRFENRYFSFSNIDAANAFTSNPSYFVKKVIELAREHVELIHVLHIEDQLIEHRNVKVLVKMTRKKRDMHNRDIQVETHITEPYFDRSYMWNIWDHRRKAQELMQILQCKTVGTMTNKCSYNMSASTQTYDNKESETQTTRDNYCNTIKRKNYIYGLRGRKDDKEFVVDFRVDHMK